jgi:hypothetical protein
VHPLTLLVTRSAYVPDVPTVGFCCVDVNPPGPLQLKLVPFVVAPVSVTEELVQVIVPPVALAPGGTVVWLTTAKAELVQPLALFNTVNVKLPDVLTVGFCWVDVNPPGPFQLKLVPVAVAPEIVVDGLSHVIVPPVAEAPGAVVFWSTDAVDVLVQPSLEFVTVSVYVPETATVGFCWVDEKAPGPLHEKFVPDVVPPWSWTLVALHVSVPPVVLAPGGVTFSVTDVNALLVQPLAEFVVVSVYVPETFTDGFCAVEVNSPGPIQRKAVPEVVLPWSWTLVVVQLSIPPIALAPGAVVFWSTDAVAVLVHPSAEFVTLNVYVPEVMTLGFCSVEVNPPGPLQLKLVPDVVADCNCTDVLAQVNVPPVALAPGGVAVWSMDAVALLEQPLVEFVTSNEYVPDTSTVGFCCVEVNPPGPLHRKLVPELVLPCNWTLVVVQVIVPPVALAPGGVVFCVTDAIAELVQPFTLFVTVSV